MSYLRTLVLSSFKRLHRTRLKVFSGDTRALTEARKKINEEFHKNKHVTDQESIKTMIQFADDVETELRTRVIQAKEIKPGVYEAKITPDTPKLDNIPFNDDAIPPEGIKRGKGCCQNKP